MEKKQGSQVLRDLQTMCHNRSDEKVDELISELRAYLAPFPGDVPVVPEEPQPDEEPERKSERGRDRQEKGGRNRSEG